MKNLIADESGNPTNLTLAASHLLVGATAGAIAANLSDGSLTAVLLTMLFVAVMHAKYDAPAAKIIVAGSAQLGWA